MATEVFNRIGESEMHEGPDSFRRFNRDNDSSESAYNVKSASKPISDAKKEFFEHLENDSLTIDTCNRLNHDWKKN